MGNIVINPVVVFINFNIRGAELNDDIERIYRFSIMLHTHLWMSICENLADCFVDAKRKNNIFFFSNFAENPRPYCDTSGIVRDVNAALNLRDKGILELKDIGR